MTYKRTGKGVLSCVLLDSFHTCSLFVFSMFIYFNFKGAEQPFNSSLGFPQLGLGKRKLS